jgi:DNA polymerase-3 subunit epsilon
MADELPHSPGVYIFRGRQGQVLYVGKSRDLRTRVKSYFYGDGRKKVEDLLAETTGVEGIECASELEALVLEARLIRSHEPKYNRHGKTWRRYAYLKIDTTEAYPRIKVVREPTGEGAYLGPFHSRSQARLAKEALEEVFPVRRCTRSMGARTRFAPCALADMGRCLAPCDGRAGRERYGEVVERLVSSLRAPGPLLAMLDERMRSLASVERFEEAAVARDRLRVLAEHLARARFDDWLVGSGDLTLRDRDGRPVRFRRGALVQGHDDEPIALPCPRDRVEELAAVRGWLARNPTVIETAERSPSEPAEGGAALHRVLRRLRAAQSSIGSGRSVPSGPDRSRSRIAR